MKNSIPKTIPVTIMLTVILWGSAFPSIHLALQSFEPFQLAPYRFTVASLALIFWGFHKKIPFPKWPDVPGLLISGAVGIGVYNLSLNTGQKTVTAGAASLLINTAPIWTAMMAQAFLNDRLHAIDWLGIFTSFIGVVFIVLKKETQFSFDRGAVLVLIASLSHSFYIVSMKRHLKKYGPFAATTYAIIAGTITLLFFSHGLLSSIQRASLHANLLVVYLGLFPAALAYVLWADILSYFPAAKASSFLYFVPVASVIISWIWIGEFLTWRIFIGGLLILGGVTMLNKKKISLPPAETPSSL